MKTNKDMGKVITVILILAPFIIGALTGVTI